MILLISMAPKTRQYLLRMFSSDTLVSCVYDVSNGRYTILLRREFLGPSFPLVTIEKGSIRQTPWNGLVKRLANYFFQIIKRIFGTGRTITRPQFHSMRG